MELLVSESTLLWSSSVLITGRRRGNCGGSSVLDAGAGTHEPGALSWGPVPGPPALDEHAIRFGGPPGVDAWGEDRPALRFEFHRHKKLWACHRRLLQMLEPDRAGARLRRVSDGANRAEPPSRLPRLLAAVGLIVGLVGLTAAAYMLGRSSSDEPNGIASSASPGTAATAQPTPSSPALSEPSEPTEPDPDDPRSYHTTDGTVPSLFPDCNGALGLCLGNPSPRVNSMLKRAAPAGIEPDRS